MKNKLAMFDMDGTLFDTRTVNYCAYRKALQTVGCELDYDWFLKNCYGRNYRDFLPPLTEEIETVHELKKKLYGEFLPEAVENTHLFSILEGLRGQYYTALVTTASRKNTLELLRCFGRESCFDRLVTQENVRKNKPDPEAYLYTMGLFGVKAADCIIFEDSATGIAAAEASGANLYVVKGFA